MATSGSNEKELTNCKLCDQELVNPKLLPCQHTFCTNCLKSHVYKDGHVGLLFCPTCQYETQVTPHQVDVLPDNFLFEILQETLRSKLGTEEKCISCENQERRQATATHKCLDCGDAVCAKCKPYHCSFSQTRNHRLVEMKVASAGKYNRNMQTKTVLCVKHSTPSQELPLKYYCMDCDSLECDQCFELEHKIHGPEKWQDLREGKTKKLDSTLQALLFQQELQERVVKTTERVKDLIKSQKETQETNIYSIANDLQALLEKIKTDKVALVKEHFDKELEQCQQILGTEKNLLLRIDATVKFIQSFLANCTNAEYLLHEDDIITRLLEYNKEKEEFFIHPKYVFFDHHLTEDTAQAINDAFGRGVIKIKKIDALGNEKKRKFMTSVMDKVQTRVENIYGLAVATDGNIIAVGGTRIEMLNHDLTDARLIQCTQLHNAWNVLIKGQRFVISETEPRRLVVCDKEGNIKKAIKITGKDKGAIGLAMDDKDSSFVFLSSASSDIIYRCNVNDGTITSFITKDQQPSLDRPSHLCTTPRHELVVSNHGGSTIQVYNERAELMWQYDGTTVPDLNMKLGNPNGICCDREGNIYIADSSNHRIQVISEGNFVGSINLSDTLKNPQAVALTCDENELLVSSGNSIIKISVWQ